jgi:NAD(P)-dependent dehydrogenase (short-subunit alcohol dehydrogenase family)
VATVIDQYGGLDVVVNNAGIERQAFVSEATVEEYRHVQEINSTGVFLGCKHAVRAMKPGGASGRGGSIINISSIAGITGITALSAYSASKGAVRTLTKAVAVECAQLQLGVRCNSIHPGLIKTSMGDRFIDKYIDLGLAPDREAIETAFLAEVPMGQWGATSDIAAGALYLASDASRFVTGLELVIDGGYIAI